MANILPRFLQSLALVAKGLGREAREMGEQTIVDIPAHSPTALLCGIVTRTVLGMLHLCQGERAPISLKSCSVLVSSEAINTDKSGAVWFSACQVKLSKQRCMWLEQQE